MTRRQTEASEEHDPDAPFPFSPAVRTTTLTCWVVAVGLLALACAPLAVRADEPAVGALSGAIFLLGLAFLVLSCGAIGPSLDHHQRTGRYLIPVRPRAQPGFIYREPRARGRGRVRALR